jgi:peptidoglycan-associated lipoprotein
MRYTRLLTASALAALLTLGATGCAKKTPPPAPPPPPPAATPAPPPPPPPPPPAPAPERPLTEEEIFAKKTLEQLNAEKPLADVFFDLDQSNLKDEARASLQKNAEWMKRWTSTKVTVEGHCDSRGTAEYNLALGERRATAVREYLVSLGVAGDRVQAISKGKEQPFCTEENESCWAQNRRGHFIITAK